MGLRYIIGCWICMFSICYCGRLTQKFSINNIDAYKKPIFVQLYRNTQFNGENITVSSQVDTNQVQDKSHAHKVTFAKIGLETIGAAAGGFIFGYAATIISPEFDNLETWWITFPMSIAVGTALGATLVGNQLMDPNGSFIGSLAGSSLGTAIGCPIAFTAVLIGLLSHDDRDDEILAWLAVAGALPVAGAVHGYNIKYKGCCSASVQTDFDSDLHLRSNSSGFSCKVQLFTLRF